MRNPLFAAVYDRVLARQEQSGLAGRRAELLARAGGAVLEVGAGTGLNVAHYPPEVTRLVLSEPDPGMLRRLRRRAAHRDAEVVDAPAQRLPFSASEFDHVVCTLVLCSVADRPAALAEIRRVLRPGGRLRFLEHVAATPDGPSTLQRVVQPAQRVLAGGCRLNLSMGDSLRSAGFVVESIADWQLPAAPPWVRPAVVGVAVNPA